MRTHTHKHTHTNTHTLWYTPPPTPRLVGNCHQYYLLRTEARNRFTTPVNVGWIILFFFKGGVCWCIMLYELVGSWGLQGEGLSTSRCILQCQTLRATSRCLLYIERHKNSSGPEGNAGPGLIYTASEVQVINCRNSLRSLSLARTLTSV